MIPQKAQPSDWAFFWLRFTVRKLIHRMDVPEGAGEAQTCAQLPISVVCINRPRHVEAIRFLGGDHAVRDFGDYKPRIVTKASAPRIPYYLNIF